MRKLDSRIIILSTIAFVLILGLAFFANKLFFEPKKNPQAKVAIVIDDWGYNLRCLNLLNQINVPVTISILPNLRYSSKIADTAKSLDKEIILHMPMEPESGGREIGLEQYTITSDMRADEIVDYLERAFSSVPYARGLSNHMGSHLTKQRLAMSIIFSELKQRDLFFLDNLVVENSVCRQLAREMEVKFASRDFFLDNSDNYEYIKEQFDKLAEFAMDAGEAVGIAHARTKSLEVFRDIIPLMQEKGIRFVFVSDLAR